MTDFELPKRARVARTLARLELVVAAIVAFALVPFLYLALSGPWGESWHPTAMLAVAIGWATFGFIWMLRIYRDAAART